MEIENREGIFAFIQSWINDIREPLMSWIAEGESKSKSTGIDLEWQLGHLETCLEVVMEEIEQRDGMSSVVESFLKVLRDSSAESDSVEDGYKRCIDPDLESEEENGFHSPIVDEPSTEAVKGETQIGHKVEVDHPIYRSADKAPLVDLSPPGSERSAPLYPREEIEELTLKSLNEDELKANESEIGLIASDFDDPEEEGEHETAKSERGRYMDAFIQIGGRNSAKSNDKLLMERKASVVTLQVKSNVRRGGILKNAEQGEVEREFGGVYGPEFEHLGPPPWSRQAREEEIVGEQRDRAWQVAAMADKQRVGRVQNLEAHRKVDEGFLRAVRVNLLETGSGLQKRVGPFQLWQRSIFEFEFGPGFKTCGPLPWFSPRCSLEQELTGPIILPMKHGPENVTGRIAMWQPAWSSDRLLQAPERRSSFLQVKQQSYEQFKFQPPPFFKPPPQPPDSFIKYSSLELLTTIVVPHSASYPVFIRLRGQADAAGDGPGDGPNRRQIPPQIAGFHISFSLHNRNLPSNFGVGQAERKLNEDTFSYSLEKSGYQPNGEEIKWEIQNLNKEILVTIKLEIEFSQKFEMFRGVKMHPVILLNVAPIRNGFGLHDKWRFKRGLVSVQAGFEVWASCDKKRERESFNCSLVGKAFLKKGNKVSTRNLIEHLTGIHSKKQLVRYLVILAYTGLYADVSLWLLLYNEPTGTLDSGSVNCMTQSTGIARGKFRLSIGMQESEEIIHVMTNGAASQVRCDGTGGNGLQMMMYLIRGLEWEPTPSAEIKMWEIGQIGNVRTTPMFVLHKLIMSAPVASMIEAAVVARLLVVKKLRDILYHVHFKGRIWVEGLSTLTIPPIKTKVQQWVCPNLKQLRCSKDCIPSSYFLHKYTRVQFFP